MKVLKPISIIAILFLSLILFSFSTKEESKEIKSATESQVAYFASGCFWCVEAIFESVNGVEEAVSGYAGGFTKNPTYKTIGTGRTGHAETVAVYYNPKLVSFETLVAVFFASHNPTTINGQHPDYGSQYRSIVFYTNDKEKAIIETAISTLNKTVYKGEIATEVTQLKKFYEAEAYHQNFEKRNPNQPYVKAVSIPRLNRFKKKMPSVLKVEARLR
jgi:peptide-methionine (S)-S-oxide reductase